MVIKGTRGVVADNSGAVEVEVFGIKGGTGKRSSFIGEIVKVAAKTVKPNTKVKKGDTFYAIVTRTKYPLKRKDGSILKANENAFILLDNSQSELIGTRVFGYVPREVIDTNKDVKKLSSLCKEVF